jgi:hypothetical protein
MIAYEASLSGKDKTSCGFGASKFFAPAAVTTFGLDFIVAVEPPAFGVCDSSSSSSSQPASSSTFDAAPIKSDCV